MLYRTIQDSYDLFRTLSKVYKSLGYKQSHMKLTIKIRHNRKKFTITYTYTDDTMNDSSDKKEIKKAKQELEECYDAKAIKKIDHILGIKVEKIKEEI